MISQDLPPGAPVPHDGSTHAAPVPPPEAAPLAPRRAVPRATYRLQLHREFGFRQATLALPYLTALGISHVYCSPYLRATAGSMHGYDVVDPGTINPDLGSAADFDRFNRQLRAHGLSQLLDIVPNHMGVESADNTWWQDVLRNGEASPYACYFDIDWSGANGVPRGRLLLPILGAPLEQVLAEGQLQLRRDETAHAFRLHYFDRVLPVNARGTALVFGTAASEAEREASSDDASDAACDADDDGLARALADPALVAEVAACQHYQLAPWQDAATRINYRRFFDVSGLAALRIEDPAVFEATHRLVIELVRAGIVSGLRVDHPDGLRDPGDYFRRLQAAVAAEDERPPKSAGPLYIVAEKILAEGEDLPADWPVGGTTGYDFANLACGVLLDVGTARRIDAIWREFTGERTVRFGDMAREAKEEVLGRSFGSELQSLSRAFRALLPQPLQAEQTPGSIGEVLTQAIACFPVYRTYPGAAASDDARRFVRHACSEARRRLDGRGGQPADSRHAILAALEEILTGPTGDYGADAVARRRGEWAVRFQQLCAPVMAKGVEDTALYRWTRLVSINDVGADPDVAGVAPERFHEANLARRANWPHAMLATSTHDNKRGEYVRMRINVISEDPGRWREIALAWREIASRLMDQAGVAKRPSASDLYLLFQTFIGTWPIEWPSEANPPNGHMQEYGLRVKAYMTKACREAKLHTSWTAPDEIYEGSVHRLVDLMLQDPACVARIARDTRPFAWYGALNSLSLTALKLTAPGVPDIYQGASILDDSLVDPDNRRPVDFTGRQALITELAALAAKPSAQIRGALAAWLSTGDFARVKLWTIHRLLGWRALHPQLFEAGAYVPVPLSGQRARHCIAYARRNERHGVLVLASRLYRQLGFPDAGGAMLDSAVAGGATVGHTAPSPGGVWGDEAVDLEAAGIRARNFVDLLTNPVEPAPGPAQGHAPAGPAPSLRLERLLATLPLAVLSFDVDNSQP